MSSSPGYSRRASGAKRRSVSPLRAEDRRSRSHSRSRSRSRERRRRRRSKTMPSGNDDELHSRRRSKHADKYRDKRSGDREHRKSRRDSRRGSEVKKHKLRDRSPEKPSDDGPEVAVLTKTPTVAEGKTPTVAEGVTPTVAEGKTSSTEEQPHSPHSPHSPKTATTATLPATTPVRPKTARGSEAEDGAPTPDFRLSGKLAAEANTVNGVSLKYSEPAEARRPSGARWRIYVFKDGKDIDMHYVDSASAFLFGRDRKVADIPTDHPSCSSQHAVLQYRRTAEAVKPYLIDLASTNGTFLNGRRIPEQRFVELRSEDVIKLGFSSREFVLLQE
ncbi:Smad nuclear-interacting protein 1 [Coemansia sp. RSA 518]|nr:Smad nuclear-interacting protein 1 [Coemansia sp. RSA 1591]KAJ1765316.1 Smad nuclear-interacting protein 1 [Coemansia sp. RSA 1752]KAJ1790907.1 Smad nuclear-interacting protein 1 [Coemansia sp. RSA 1938]KAJ2140404.1 Smad nuclear-interacting protein 1 [Coemansia sp. RSA 564]KAJ2185181.1 Smad nuclear-interacting protein 1 [Coemansia sp. RSA 532]KAJ2221559.1 Smad nuclear-interacting protein 1 [Coemansia sp. RSA 518]KAJ2403658.1 Smad nuclear-interacting protein 1 [Coemansia sp. RSA 2526]KAJ24